VDHSGNVSINSVTKRKIIGIHVYNLLASAGQTEKERRCGNQQASHALKVRNSIRIGPLDSRVFPEPGQLTFGIPAGIGLDIVDGFIQGGIPVKVLEYLFISNGLESIMVAVRQQPLDFFDQALFDHVVYAVMDAAVQLFFWKVQADLADAERALPRCAAAKAQDRPARGEAYF
jgi:hypothetical protein